MNIYTSILKMQCPVLSSRFESFSLALYRTFLYFHKNLLFYLFTLKTLCYYGGLKCCKHYKLQQKVRLQLDWPQFTSTTTSKHYIAHTLQRLHSCCKPLCILAQWRSRYNLLSCNFMQAFSEVCIVIFQETLFSQVENFLLSTPQQIDKYIYKICCD